MIPLVAAALIFLAGCALIGIGVGDWISDWLDERWPE